MKYVKKIGVFGMGLMGGSLALAVKDKFPQTDVWGYARSKRSYDRVKKLKVTDRVSRRLEEVARGADMIALALPVEVNIEYLKSISPHLKKGCIVFDLGSTKHMIESQAPKIIPAGVSFVGCHPLCGSEKSGAESSRKDLYRDEICVITSSVRKAATKKIASLWSGLGAKAVFMKPGLHDKILSQVSHLPHAVSFVLTSYVESRFLKFSSGSFRDLTRVSASPAYLWSEIFLSNRLNLLKDIRGFLKSLERLKTILEKKDRKSLTDFIKRVNLKHKKAL